MPLLDLPAELIVYIASLLPSNDLLAVQQVSVRLRDLIKSSLALQYLIELHVAGMVDNPASRLVPGDRLRILRQKETAWRSLDLSERKVLPLQHNPSGIYDLTGGVLLLGERRQPESHTGTDSVHTVHLQSAFRNSQDDAEVKPPLWRTVDLGKQVIDVGLSIQEHDLLAIVTYSYVNSAQLYASIDIHLIQHSTGQPHPAAARPVLHFDNIHYLPGHCSIMLEVAGDTLCFLLNNYFPFVSADPVTLVVYNWKTGHPVVGQKRIYSDPTMFNSFILLSPDTVVLPIIPTNALEICNFAKELAAPPPPPYQGEGPPPPTDVPLLETSCILNLPALKSGALVLRMTCRCEPNPRGGPGSATFQDTQVPFKSNPDTALMILHMHIRLPLNTSRMYTLIVHRSSLLQIVRAALDERQSKRELLSCLRMQTALSEDVDLKRFAGDAAEEEEEEQPAVLDWTDWGPRVTRWFQDELAGTRWITTTCGQRLIRVKSRNGQMRLHVYDFNRLALKRFLHERALQGEPFGSRRGESILEAGFHEFPRRGVDIDEADDDDDNDGEGGNGQALNIMDYENIDMGFGLGAVDGPILVGWLADLAEEPQDVAMLDDPREPVASSGETAETSSPPLHLKRKVMLGTTVIAESSVWEEQMESSLPYIETSVPLGDEYESALVDEDIIIGLKMDQNGRHITEVVLHRMGGPVE